MADIDYFPRLTEVFTFENKPLMFAAVLSNLVGYLQYIYVIRLSLSEGRNPMPLWMHCFYFAHDTTWTYTLTKLAPSYGDHWFLTGTATALGMFAAMETWTIYMAIFHERDAVFGALLGRKNPPVSAAAAYTAAIVTAMYAVVWVVIELFPRGGVLHWFCLTNVLIAIGPLHHYLRAGSRHGLSLGYCLVSLFGTAFTFSPFGLFVLALPDVFDTPMYYTVGVMLVAFCAGCMYVVASYPPKTRAMTKDGKEPIW